MSTPSFASANGRCMVAAMTKQLAQVFAEIEKLSETEQERIAEELGAYLRKLHDLREELDRGLRSLEAGAAKELDIEEVIARARAGATKASYENYRIDCFGKDTRIGRIQTRN
jgi:hypothetical protein